MKGNIDSSSSNVGKNEALPSGAAVLSKQERKERAVKEREQKVKAELSRVEINIEKSRMGINKEEGERDYKCVAHPLLFLANTPCSSDVISIFLGPCSSTLSGIHRYEAMFRTSDG